MKNYQKPNMDVKSIQLSQAISTGIAGWLESNVEYSDAVITTFVVES